MYRYLGIVLALLGTLGWGQDNEAASKLPKGPRTFALTLPENWKQANSLILIFKDLEVPENRGVTFHLVPAGAGEHEAVGFVSIVATSRTAKGTQHLGEVVVNLGKEFRGWAETAKPGQRLSLVVKPFEGSKEIPDYPWTVRELKLETR
jgi:hypothetical protein